MDTNLDTYKGYICKTFIDVADEGLILWIRMVCYMTPAAACQSHHHVCDDDTEYILGLYMWVIHVGYR